MATEKKFIQQIIKIKPTLFMLAIVVIYIIAAILIYNFLENSSVTIADNHLQKRLLIVIFTTLAISVLCIYMLFLHLQHQKKNYNKTITNLKTEIDNQHNEQTRVNTQNLELENKNKLLQREINIKQSLLNIYENKLRAEHSDLKKIGTTLINNQKLIKKLTERAEVSDRYKSAFVACISHEINTPIHGMSGFADMLCRPTLTPERRAEFTLNLSLTAKRFHEVLDNIMLYSKIQAGDISFTTQPFDVNFMLSNINMHSELLINRSKKDLQIKFGCNFKEKRIITSYEEGIRIILLKLIDNAIKFSNTGKIAVDYHITDTKILFSVTDNGIGIPSNKYDEIFDSFFQVDNNLSRAYSGLGIGLSICKGLLNMMDGRISVDSQIGEGSTFSFYVPAIITPRKTIFDDEIAEATNLTPAKGKILIITPNNTDAELLANILEQCGCTAIQVNQPENTINFYKNNSNIKLIIIDIEIVEAYSIALQLLQNDITTKIVFLVPKQDNNFLLEKATTVGRSIIKKPLTHDNVLNTLNDLLIIDKEKLNTIS